MSTRLGGRYQLVREIGQGGMGRVFQAVDTETGRTVAAKVMIASSEDNLEALLRFQQEGAVLSTLKHPNIVEVYGTFLEEHTSCIIMELLEGRSLSQILRAERLPLPRIKHIMEQVASALAYAHGRAIVHRDIKPDNVMVIGNDHVKVTDFGIARILRTGATLNTMTGMSIGTPLYMAPEQIEGQKVDGRADIYSFGAVLYQLVTGRPPFEGEDPLTVAFKHVHKAPQPPSEVNADVPEDWEGLILKTLAKDPGDRFQTAAALLEAMSVLSTGEVVRPRPEAPRPAADQQVGPALTPTPLPSQTLQRPAQPAPEIPTVVPPVDRPAASTVSPAQPSSVHPPPGGPAPEGQTIVRPPETPGQVSDQGSTVLRPAAPGQTERGLGAGGQTVLRPAPEQPDMAAGAGGQTVLRPVPEPAETAPEAGGQTMLRPTPETPGTIIRPTPEAPRTIIRPPAEPPADQTMVQPRVRDVAPTKPPPAMRPVVVPKQAEPLQPETKLRGAVPWLPIAGAVAALIVIAGGLFFFLNKGSPTKASSGPTPVPPTPASVVPSLSSSGTDSAVSGQKVHLRWTAVTNAASYRLQVATAATDPSDAVVFKHILLSAVTHKTSYALHVVGHQYYYWRVQARVAGKWGAFALSRHFVVAKPRIGKPVPLSPRNGTARIARQMKLCWSGVPAAADYKLKVAGSSARVVHGTCAWISVHPGAYHWRVAAQVKGVQIYTGSYSVPADFTIRQKPKPTPTPTPQPQQPTAQPTQAPVQQPTQAPVQQPTQAPVQQPTQAPVQQPTQAPYQPPTAVPKATKPVCNGESC